ncbi:MBL fold metallo-hydrolase [uncultured Roseibium sp.]|uniref:ribonuclease Z n=1 Tax=uncultured Roseibium sp. TaxID=1936171 RepID=UPI003217AB00
MFPVYVSPMRPKFHPSLVNDRFGDPALYIDFRQERRAILFDLGDIHTLSPRQILRLSDVFVSHTHIDHFIGFDHFLRVLVGRDKEVRLYGPSNFIDRVEAKLASYTWDLVERFQTELVFTATEVGAGLETRTSRFRFSHRFIREDLAKGRAENGVLLAEPALTVTCAELEHHSTCLGFALQESTHVNVWKNRIQEQGLTTGPWLATLKAAIHEGQPDDTPISAERDDGTREDLPLGFLREEIISIEPGQKIAYVTDAVFSPANQTAIVNLARNADILFIDAAFAEGDVELAAHHGHLTTAQAGSLARRAGAARAEPFHFSPRYEDYEDRMIAEVDAAFNGD